MQEQSPPSPTQSCSPVDSTRTQSQSSSNLDYETFQAIQSLKSRHKHVYSTSADDKTVVFRPLTWKEQHSLVEGATEDCEQADNIVKACLLYPEYDSLIEDFDAGVVETLATEIVSASGFSSVEAFNEGLIWAREETQKVEYEVIAAICKAFPAYTPEDVYDLQFLDIMVRLAIAEKILGMSPEMSQEDSLPITPGMEAFGGPPPRPGPVDEMYATPPIDMHTETLMRSRAKPPDFDRDNAELTRHG